MNLFSTKLKDFLDKAIKFHPIGTTFHIQVEPRPPCPFTVRDIEDQIRSVYGPLNNSIFFGVEEGGRYDAETETSNEMRRETLPWIRGFLNDRMTLDQGELPPEVLHWFKDYKARHQELISFITL